MDYERLLHQQDQKEKKNILLQHSLHLLALHQLSYAGFLSLQRKETVPLRKTETILHAFQPVFIWKAS